MCCLSDRNFCLHCNLSSIPNESWFSLILEPPCTPLIIWINKILRIKHRINQSPFLISEIKLCRIFGSKPLHLKLLKVWNIAEARMWAHFTSFTYQQVNSTVSTMRKSTTAFALICILFIIAISCIGEINGMNGIKREALKDTYIPAIDDFFHRKVQSARKYKVSKTL